ncbi:MAG TPA: hypothetical protein VMC85_05405 [Desulfomonilaceae bacterium]|nr:hypothetical protein [Desulfomonilaceae bacterium]
MDWTAFFSVLGAAAATVIGLLFVAVQLSAEKIVGDQSDRWWAIAFSTFYLFLTVFFVSLSYLSPALKSHGRALWTLILVAIYIFRMGQTSLLIWHGMFRRRGERLWETFWNLAAPLIIYLLLGYHGLRAFLGDPRDNLDEQVALLLAILFGLALRNSWHLVVEGVFRRRK